METNEIVAIVPPDSLPEVLPYLQSTLLTIPLEGEYSFGIAASSDGTKILVSNKDSQNVSVLGFGSTPVTGDVCETAIPLIAPAFCLEGCTTGYTDQYNEACPFLAAGASDLVYRLEPLVTDTVNIDLCASQFDTKIYIYQGACGEPNGGEAIYCNDDACGTNGWRSQLEQVIFEAGETYFIVIDGYGAADAGGFNLCFASDCPADLDNDGSVRVPDLLIFLQGVPEQFGVSHLLEFTSFFGQSCD